MPPFLVDLRLFVSGVVELCAATLSQSAGGGTRFPQGQVWPTGCRSYGAACPSTSSWLVDSAGTSPKCHQLEYSTDVPLASDVVGWLIVWNGLELVGRCRVPRMPLVCAA